MLRHSFTSFGLLTHAYRGDAYTPDAKRYGRSSLPSLSRVQVTIHSCKPTTADDDDDDADDRRRQ